MDRAAPQLTAGLQDIWQSYLRPRAVFLRKDQGGIQESRLLGWLMLACIISFVARLPGVIATSDAQSPLEAIAGANMVASLIFAPLFFYALAALVRLIARILGGNGTGQQARLALFWSLFATQPLVIATEILSNLAALDLVQQLFSVISALVFLRMWGVGIVTFERSGP